MIPDIKLILIPKEGIVKRGAGCLCFERVGMKIVPWDMLQEDWINTKISHIFIVDVLYIKGKG